MPEDSLSRQDLTLGASQVVQSALDYQQSAKSPELGTNHWLAALVERNAAFMQTLALDFSAGEARQRIKGELAGGKAGIPLAAPEAIARAIERARSRGRSQASERDLAVVVLTAAGYHLADPNSALRKMAIASGSEKTASQSVAASSDEIQSPSQETEAHEIPSEGPITSVQTHATAAVAVQDLRKASIRPVTNTPTLNQYGRDLTRAAQEGKLTPIIGRDEEVQLVIETLCRRSKRNPVLVGPAGVGKTAIVEGLAQQIVGDLVPDPLWGCRLIALQPSVLVAGASISGELEKRMKAIIQEASQDGIILFIDELHSAIGAGGMVGTNDIASILKPALARGDLACIAATTDDEYRRFIEPDTALERRFQPIRVQELSPEATLQILKLLRDSLGQKHGVQVGDGILAWLVNFGQQYMRNRHFPDKAVDLLEQCVAHAISLNKVQVELEDAQKVAQRMVGMPLGLDERLTTLENVLVERALLSDEDVHALVNRLQVTLRGLDLRPTRPNAVLLLTGQVAENSEGLAEGIASALFGAPDRVIAIDFSRFAHPEDINLLVGAPPGYVGYSESLPIHRLVQIPWSVLRLENIDACYPGIREVVTRALAEGFITDGRGKAIYMSDAVVLLTAHLIQSQQRGLGFAPVEAGATANLFQQAENSSGA